MTRRAAVIDLGTNSALLTVGERDGDRVRVVEDVCTIVRLGRGVERAGRLDEGAKARTRDCIEVYLARARALGAARVVIVATAVLRDAHDGAEFLHELTQGAGGSATGEIVTGEREAELAFAGALGGLALPDGATRVLDVGGGSSEIVVGAPPRIDARASLPVGAVRLTERCVRSDPPSAQDLESIVRETHLALACLPGEAFGAGAPWLVAVAGTATTLAAIDLALATYDGARVHGKRMSQARIEALRDHLASMTLADRRAVVGLAPERADVIVAGATLVLECARRLAAREIIVSDRGLRHARLEELLAG